jgi:SHS2 domain-containing protein
MTAHRARWEHFSHGADIGIRGIGGTREQAFAAAATALTAVVTDSAQVAPREAVKIHVTAGDDETLLVGWLNELVYEMATRQYLFGRFEVRIEDGDLAATAWGEPVDVDRHQPAVEVKGATYTELKVVRMDDGAWLAQCVVDV